MTETTLKQVPVKIEYGGKWISTKIGVNEEKYYSLSLYLQK